MTLERGAILNNRYKINDVLGQGGMAALYRAVDMNLGVEVAVKENLFTTEEYARQFRLEAEILATLRHPNLPRVTDHFVIDGQGQYLVMDYIEGEDLRQRIDRSGVLSDEEAIVVGVAICDALMYMHSLKPMVLHRDIKPGNVKITPTGQVFLVDFGLAKVVLGRSATETGARAMTPGYSPPEQYGTARTDQRSDIYSLGATLYSALTDNLPEDGLARAMDQAHLTPVRKRNEHVSRRLDRVLEKALEVQPENRFQTAADFRRELLNSRSTSVRKEPIDLYLSPPPDIFSDGEKQYEESDAAPGEDLPFPIVSRPASRPAERKSRGGLLRKEKGFLGFWVSISLVVLVGAFATGIYIFNPTLPVDIIRKYLPSSQGTEQAAETPSPSSTESLPVVLPPEATHTLPARTTPRPLTTSTQVKKPSPTPAPTETPLGGGVGEIAFASDRNGVPQIFISTVDGTRLTPVTNIDVGACQPSWSPDGLKIVFVSPCLKEQETYPGSSLFIINTDGSGLTQLSDVSTGDFEPSWSPDGKYIAFTSLRDDRRPKVYRINTITNQITLLASEGPVNMQPVWSPDSKQIAFITNRKGPYQIWIMNANGTDQQRFSSDGTAKNTYPVWAPDGKIMIFTQSPGDGGVPMLFHSVFGDQINSGIRVSPSVSAPMRDASISPDGRWIAYETWQEGEDHNISLINISGITNEFLINDPAFDFDPAFRP
ncbi:MAG: hypothetical protein EHM41_11780 [Chloroflexi bacterium]|nr:MAG: hypothetical protein EHM41_11780 [Chloroflexota bacterium]